LNSHRPALPEQDSSEDEEDYQEPNELGSPLLALQYPPLSTNVTPALAATQIFDDPDDLSLDTPIAPTSPNNMSGAAAAANHSELKIATSTFDGDRDKAHSWLLKTTAYLDINRHHYDTDEKKIIFATRLMSEGPTAKWSEDLLETTQTRVATTAGTTAP
jgi:hypothetical protein